MQDLENAHKVAQSKAYLDFGETFAPLYEAYAEVVNSVKMPQSCDKDCFMNNCMQSHGGFSYGCAQRCGCYVDESKVQQAVKDLENKYGALGNDLNRHFEEILAQFFPTIMRHEQMKQKVTEEYFALVREHAAPMCGCDQ